VVCLALGSFAGNRARADEGDALVDYVVATVNGEAITWTALRDEAELRGLRPDDSLDRRQMLQLLVDELLFVGEARNFVIITDASVDEAIAVAIAAADAAGTVSMEARRERVRRQLMLTQFADRAFGARVPRPSDVEILSHYDGQIEDYQRPAEYRVRTVRVRSASEADTELATGEALLVTLREALLAGREPADMDDTWSAQGFSVNVEVEWTALAALPSAIADIVVALDAEEWSDPLREGAGHAIVQVVDFAPPWTQELGPELADSIARVLRARRVQTLMQDWLDERREAADIRILDSELAPPVATDTQATSHVEGK
jgi:hypothetical protein